MGIQIIIEAVTAFEARRQMENLLNDTDVRGVRAPLGHEAPESDQGSVGQDVVKSASATMAASQAKEHDGGYEPFQVAADDIELDSAGMPWDARIHASTKTKVKDGTWKKMRGVDEDLVAEVEAELAAAPEPEVEPTEEPAVETEPEDSQEVQAQDEADEQAESTREELTHDDVRNALSAYVDKFGMAAAQEDGPKVLQLIFGEGVTKVSQVPGDQDSFAKAVSGINEMAAKNPYKRAEV